MNADIQTCIIILLVHVMVVEGHELQWYYCVCKFQNAVCAITGHETCES